MGVIKVIIPSVFEMIIITLTNPRCHLRVCVDTICEVRTLHYGKKKS